MPRIQICAESARGRELYRLKAAGGCVRGSACGPAAV